MFYIALQQPQSTDVWYNGSTYDILWTFQGAFSTVNITLILALVLGDFLLAFESFILFLMNIAIINICAIAVFKIKKIQPMPPAIPLWVRKDKKDFNK